MLKKAFLYAPIRRDVYIWLPDEERVEACVALLRSVKRILPSSLQTRCTRIYIDGGAALKAAFLQELPEAKIVRCLQHVKRNVIKAAKYWNGRSKSKKVKSWVEKSAFLPPALFHFLPVDASRLLLPLALKSVGTAQEPLIACCSTH